MSEIAKHITEMIKAQYNLAAGAITRGDYQAAQEAYEQAGYVSHLVKYDQGVAMAFLSLANLCLLRADDESAWNYALSARAYDDTSATGEQAQKLLQSMALTLLKQAIELERSGRLEEALTIFIKIQPQLNPKRAELVAAEIETLRRQLGL